MPLKMSRRNFAQGLSATVLGANAMPVVILEIMGTWKTARHSPLADFRLRQWPTGRALQACGPLSGGVSRRSVLALELP